jgi:hypothetical protein
MHMPPGDAALGAFLILSIDFMSITGIVPAILFKAIPFGDHHTRRKGVQW